MTQLISPAAALQQFGVNVQEGAEAIYQPLYDIQAYPTAGFISKTFFAEPIGQSSKTISDTNMQSAGQLPQPQMFLVQTLEVILAHGSPLIDVAAATGTAANEMKAILESGAITFTIGSKPYLTQAPLMAMPFANQLDTEMAISVTTASDVGEASYVTAKGPVFNMARHGIPLLIPSNQNFDVKMAFESVKVMAVAGRVGIRLGGVLYRSRQ